MYLNGSHRIGPGFVSSFVVELQGRITRMKSSYVSVCPHWVHRLSYPSLKGSCFFGRRYLAGRTFATVNHFGLQINYILRHNAWNFYLRDVRGANNGVVKLVKLHTLIKLLGESPSSGVISYKIIK
jgi:hypothetical protein